VGVFFSTESFELLNGDMIISFSSSYGLFIAIICIILFRLILKAVNSDTQDEKTHQFVLFNMLFYPLVLMVIWTIPFISFVSTTKDHLNGETNIGWLSLLLISKITAPLQGLLNSIIFGIAIYRKKRAAPYKFPNVDELQRLMP